MVRRRPTRLGRPAVVAMSVAVVAVAAGIVGTRDAGTGGTIRLAERDEVAMTTTAPTTAEQTVERELRVVPPTRDVRVRIGGQVVASDAAGVIELPVLEGEVELVVLGYSATPAVQQVRFVQWSDGDPAAIRTIDPTRPVPAIEVEVLHRVVVDAAGLDPISFDSAIGRVDLRPGEPAWVPALRADQDGLVTYTVVGGGSTTYRPTPEARWTVQRRTGGSSTSP